MIADKRTTIIFLLKKLIKNPTITKIRTELGWKPKYTFKEMMEEMADYWLEYFGKNK